MGSVLIIRWMEEPELVMVEDNDFQPFWFVTPQSQNPSATNNHTYPSHFGPYLLTDLKT